MKKTTLFAICVAFATHVFAQSTTTWFPPGAQWAYSFESLGGPGDEYIQYAGPAVKGGLDCVHLQSETVSSTPWGGSSTTDYYLRLKNDTVLVWHENSNSYKLLYDFTRMPGDVIQPLYSGFYQYAVVEAVGDTLWNSIPVRYQDLRLEGGFAGTDPYYTRVYERLGGEHIVHWDIQSPITEIQYFLGCYRDDQYPIAECLPPQEGPYFPFASGVFPQAVTAVWSEEKDLWCSFTGYQYKTEGDTVIFGVGQGKKLLYRTTYEGSYPCPNEWIDFSNGPWQLLGLINQYVPDKKVYFTRLSDDQSLLPPALWLDAFPQAGETVLLYDFDLEPGQILPWKPGANQVASIDSVQVDDGTWRQRYFFIDSLGTVDSLNYWLEGIGGSYGLFSSYYNTHLTDISHHFKCLKANSTLTYSTVGAAWCDSISVSINPVPPELQFYIIPNPFSTFFSVYLPGVQTPATFELYDACGRLLMRRDLIQENTQIDLATLPASAVYLAKVTDATGAFATRKLVH